MFGNSENWGIIVDTYHNTTELLQQLFHIFNEVRNWYMNELSGTFTSLTWYIGVYEELTKYQDNELNGKNIKVDTSCFYNMNDFQKCRESINDDEKFKTELIGYIYQYHRQVDEVADAIPKMIQYLMKLKHLYHNPIELQKFKAQNLKNNPTWSDITLQSLPDDANPITFPVEPVIHVYHIADSLPCEEEEIYGFEY